MNLSLITPLIITWNEEPNIRRCLKRLTWADRVLVIDSGSTDTTIAICGEFPNTKIVHRDFDSFANQCNAGLDQIETEWVLSLDSDYLIPENFSDIAKKIDPDFDGYQFPFRYCVFGKPLRSCLYPDRTVLYRRSKARYTNDGHAHRVIIAGRISKANSPIDHDDRKPLSRWFQSQIRYAALEVEKLEAEESTSGLPDRIRKMIFPAAPLTFFYTLLAKGALFDGRAGWFYALQRTFAELLLSLMLLERRLCPKKNGENDVS
jgi:glycosyltransferase involved in cell wall biosynthesis